MCAYCDRLSLSLSSLCATPLSPSSFAPFVCWTICCLASSIFVIYFSCVSVFSRFLFLLTLFLLFAFVCWPLLPALLSLLAVPFPFTFRFLPWKIKSIVILPATSRFVPSLSPIPSPGPGPGTVPGSCCWASALCRRVVVPVNLTAFKSHKRLLLLSFYCFLYAFLRLLRLHLRLDSFIIGNQWSIRILHSIVSSRRLRVQWSLHNEGNSLNT